MLRSCGRFNSARWTHNQRPSNEDGSGAQVTRPIPVLLLVTLCWPAAAIAEDHPGQPPQLSLSEVLTQGERQSAPSCTSRDATEVVVCGRSQQRYRIDPDVLAATRAAEAPAPKPPLDATSGNPCVGPDCGGGTIPLVGIALTALKAAELAAQGDDWRDAFRMPPDQYQAYQQSKSRKIDIGITAGSQRRAAGPR